MEVILTTGFTFSQSTARCHHLLNALSTAILKNVHGQQQRRRTHIYENTLSHSV